VITQADLQQILAYVQSQMPGTQVGQGFPDTVASVFQAGDTLINQAGLFIYNGFPAHGNLLLSIASASGTDGFLNPFSGPGLKIYGAIPPSGVTRQSIFLTLVGTLAQLVLGTGSSNEVTAANVSSGLINAGLTTEVMQLILSGPKGGPVGGRDWAQMFMQSNNFSATSPATGFLMYVDDAQTAHTIAEWGGNGFAIANQAAPTATPTESRLYANNQLKYIGSDGGDYNTGRKTTITVGQTVNVAADVVISGLQFTVGTTCEYHIRALVPISANQTGGVANVSLHGPAVGSGGGGFRFTNSTSVANNWNGGGLPSGGVAMTNGQSTWIELEGWFLFSAAGIVSIQAHTSIVGDSFVVQSGSLLEIMPVT
jgi:hypothetical protein